MIYNIPTTASLLYRNVLNINSDDGGGDQFWGLTSCQTVLTICKAKGEETNREGEGRSIREASDITEHCVGRGDLEIWLVGQAKFEGEAILSELSISALER